MITKKMPLKLLLLTLSITVALLSVPQQADAKRGARSGGGGQHARSSVNRSKNVNRNRNTNVNRNKNVNVDVDVNRRGGCCGRGHYHPVATGLAIGAAAAVTSAVIGSIVYSLPSGCTTVMRYNVAYQQCGSTWYQPQYSGSNVTYTSRGYGCGIYNELIFVESKALKQAHSWLRNCFSNTAIGKNSAARNPQPWPCEVYVVVQEPY